MAYHQIENAPIANIHHSTFHKSVIKTIIRENCQRLITRGDGDGVIDVRSHAAGDVAAVIEEGAVPRISNVLSAIIEIYVEVLCYISHSRTGGRRRGGFY